MRKEKIQCFVIFVSKSSVNRWSSKLKMGCVFFVRDASNCKPVSLFMRFTESFLIWVGICVGWFCSSALASRSVSNFISPPGKNRDFPHFSPNPRIHAPSRCRWSWHIDCRITIQFVPCEVDVHCLSQAMRQSMYNECRKHMMLTLCICSVGYTTNIFDCLVLRTSVFCMYLRLRGRERAVQKLEGNRWKGVCSGLWISAERFALDFPASACK